MIGVVAGHAQAGRSFKQMICMSSCLMQNMQAWPAQLQDAWRPLCQLLAWPICFSWIHDELLCMSSWKTPQACERRSCPFGLLMLPIGTLSIRCCLLLLLGHGLTILNSAWPMLTRSVLWCADQYWHPVRKEQVKNSQEQCMSWRQKIAMAHHIWCWGRCPSKLYPAWNWNGVMQSQDNGDHQQQFYGMHLNCLPSCCRYCSWHDCLLPPQSSQLSAAWALLKLRLRGGKAAEGCAVEAMIEEAGGSW